ncbi:MAG: peptidoglycan-associated lipoprotein Pal [Ottowia sp.]|nr:peptidoglycan-associated lipoprotein Pal [Ottowia sp.]
MHSVLGRSGLMALIACVLMAACSSGVKLDEVAPGSKMPATTPSPSSTAPVDTHAVTPVAVDPLMDEKNPLSKRSIYFDYDSYVVGEQSKEIIATHARYLVSNPNRKILIQGNTDERGTTEYNLALGQKRAQAVRQALSLLGVSDGQMEAVSLGKEKPRALEHNETAWAENRRVDLVY